MAVLELTMRGARTATASAFTPRALRSFSTVAASRIPTTMPASVPSGQAFFWTQVWQAGERESAEARAAGELVRFDSDDPNDILHWLFDADD